MEANIRALSSISGKHGLEEILDSIKEWKNKRNEVLHEMVKVRKSNPNPTWAEKIELAKSTALEGIKIARKISNIVR